MMKGLFTESEDKEGFKGEVGFLWLGKCMQSHRPVPARPRDSGKPTQSCCETRQVLIRHLTRLLRRNLQPEARLLLLSDAVTSPNIHVETNLSHSFFFCCFFLRFLLFKFSWSCIFGLKWHIKVNSLSESREYSKQKQSIVIGMISSDHWQIIENWNWQTKAEEKWLFLCYFNN